MTDRPTPEEIAYAVVAELSELPTSPLALQLDWDDECRIVQRVIVAERAEADRRVLEARVQGKKLGEAHVAEWLDGIDEELAARVRRREHRK